jgi:hypothetical protein
MYSTCSDPRQLTLTTGHAKGADWHWAARWARRLAWISLALVVAEGAVGLWQGIAAGSIALTGWALGSAPEAVASLVVIWRFSGARTFSETAELGAQRGVAVSFWLTAPYVAAESVHHLLGDHEPHITSIAIAVTAAALVQMPVLGFSTDSALVWGQRLQWVKAPRTICVPPKPAQSLSVWPRRACGSAGGGWILRSV